MKLLTYDRMERMGYEYEAAVLREKFGGKGVTLTQDVAAFCAESHFCPTGGAHAIFDRYPGGKNAIGAWRRSDVRVGAAYWKLPEEQRCGLLERRWANLCRAARRFHGIHTRLPRKLAA